MNGDLPRFGCFSPKAVGRDLDRLLLHRLCLADAEQRAVLDLSDTLIAELEQADEVVIGVAMHNFSIPASLKLWIDQIVRSGRTFSYSSSGPQGLLRARRPPSSQRAAVSMKPEPPLAP